MGGAATKLRKQLQRGDEYAALQLCERHPELRKSLDPNASYGAQFGDNTPLHFASKHCMKALIRLFLNDLGGNPNKKNGDECTSLSLICQGRTRLSMSQNLDAKLRAECLMLFLAWEGTVLANGEKEKADLDAVDAKSNTALHYAAASGLKRCVEMLVTRGAKLTIENCAKETPCDSAERCAYRDIAEYLESKMVFSAENQDEANEDDMVFTASERFNGLREQDLIEAKDILLVETSDMLQVPLFTAEALLRNHEWSRDALWSSWNRDPVSCCEKCGVQPPESARACVATDREVPSTSQVQEDSEQLNNRDCDLVCEICCMSINSPTEAVTNGECGHMFCRMCWKQYTSVKIQEGDLHSISCPSFSCSKLVPLDLIEKVVSPSMARKYLKFDIKAFVESNPLIKWCPFPGCTNAVRLPNLEDEIPMYLRAFPKIQPPPPTSKTVHCPHGHAFCWDCLLEGHEPTCCGKWKDWHDKIAEVKPEALADTGTASEAAANCLWLVTHSKPCPKCKSPIQKNEGCNHMKCSKCKHDFCWVCLGQWKKHSTETGGYFRCNRYDDSRKVEEKTEQAIAEAKEQSRRAQELNRFVHYYSRYKNHLNSFEWEKSLFDKVEEKIQLLAKSADPAVESEEPIDFSFVNQAIRELLRSRKVLSSSYGYGYFLKDCGYNKTIFEYLQNELEVSVETLSGLVGRSYLRGSRTRIIKTTQLVASRRQRFLLCISRGLVPPETPPNMRKNRRGRHLPAILGLDKDDDDWVKSGMPPLEELDPNRPWVKDSRGRHHNLLAILDWPEEEGSDEDSKTPASPTENYDSLCDRKHCTKPRARNPRTGELHLYCSPNCQYLDNAMEESAESTGARQYNVDLMIALQMSRIQLLQDLKVLCDEDDDDGPGPSGIRQRPSAENAYLGEDIDPDLQLAIHRSVSEGASWFPTEENSSDSKSVHRFLKSLAEKSSSMDSGNLLDVSEELGQNLSSDAKCDKVLLQEIAGKKDDTPEKDD